MNSLPNRPFSRAKGYARLLQNLKGSAGTSAGTNAQDCEFIDLVRLDALREGLGQPELDPSESENQVWWLTIQRWEHETGSEEWIEKLKNADTETLTCLVDKLDEDTQDRPASTSSTKTKALRAYAGILRFCKAAEEYGYIEVSAYLKILRLRQRARVGEISRSEVSCRALGRTFGVDHKTIAAWNERAKKLGVTLNDWDYERLRQIVKPSKRAPP